MNKMDNNARTINFSNGTQITLLTDGASFRGIGDVSIHGVPLRNNQRPMVVDISSLLGTRISDYLLEELEISDCHASLVFSMLETNSDPRVWSEEPQQLADAKLVLDITPVTRRIGEYDFNGFQYQYHYQCDTRPIYRLLDQSSWEIGGQAVGNTFWLRNSMTDPCFSCSDVQEAYSTNAWVTPGELVQFRPWQIEFSGFTFTAAEQGVVITWARENAHIRSLFEKRAHDNAMLHLHEHCGDSATVFSTAPIEVLFAPCAPDRVTWMNLYNAAQTTVQDCLHTQAGLQIETPVTRGIIEEWGDADLDRYRSDGLPKLAKAGVKRLRLTNHFENNMNTFGIANMCCNVDFKIAASVGEDKMQALCQDAAALGIDVDIWSNNALSTTAFMQRAINGTEKLITRRSLEGTILEAINSAKRPCVMANSGAPDAGVHGPVWVVLNLADATIRAYWLNAWQYAHDNIGIKGIFYDTSAKTGSDLFDYSLIDDIPVVRSTYFTHLEVIAELQGLGLRYCNDDLGVFGIHISGARADRLLSSLFMWGGCEIEFPLKDIRQAGGDIADTFFRGIAYGIIWPVFWEPTCGMLTFSYQHTGEEEYKPTSWHNAILQAHNAVSDYMKERTILADESGVLYQDGETRVLWAFQDLEYPLLQDCQVRDLITGEEAKLNTLAAKRHHVYQIDK